MFKNIGTNKQGATFIVNNTAAAMSFGWCQSTEGPSSIDFLPVIIEEFVEVEMSNPFEFAIRPDFIDDEVTTVKQANSLHALGTDTGEHWKKFYNRKKVFLVQLSSFFAENKKDFLVTMCQRSTLS